MFLPRRESFLPRREFLAQAGAAALASGYLTRWALGQNRAESSTCRFGLVTYLWGKDLTLPQLLTACEASEVLGVELRTTHRHGVEPELSQAERRDVRMRFEDCPVALVGLGSNERFDHVEPEQLKAAIDRSKAFLQLSHDLGSTGVKVKGDQFHAGIPREQTLDQVASALRELGDFAANLNQQVRLEVHGGFQDLPVHHEIMQRTQHAASPHLLELEPTGSRRGGLGGEFSSRARFLRRHGPRPPVGFGRVPLAQAD